MQQSLLLHFVSEFTSVVHLSEMLLRTKILQVLSSWKRKRSRAMGEFLALERSLPVGFETLPDISEKLVRPIDTTVPTPPCSPASSTLEASRTSVIGNS